MATDPKAIWQRYLDEVWNQGHMEACHHPLNIARS